MSFFADLALASAGPIIGGLFGGKSKATPKPVPDYTPMQHSIRWRVDDAKRAGIHPLYALGAGTNSPVLTYGSGPRDAVAGGLATGIGDAVTSAGRSYIARREREKQQRQQMARQGVLDAASVRESDSRTALAAAQREESFMRQQLMAAQIAKLSQSGQNNPGLFAEKTLPYPSGYKWKTGASVGQQEMEDQYGGIVGEIYGVNRFMRDFRSNLPRILRERRFKDKRRIEREKTRAANPGLRRMLQKRRAKDRARIKREQSKLRNPVWRYYQ
jgi:hypothetical protein